MAINPSAFDFNSPTSGSSATLANNGQVAGATTEFIGPVGPPAGYKPATTTKPTTTTSTKPATTTTPTNNIPQPESVDPLIAEIDNMYNSAMGYANQAEQNIYNAQPGVYDAINTQATSAIGRADTSKAQSERTIASEKEAANARNINYMAQARQALSEGTIGANQRFGRGSNLGKALGEYSTVNFQKQAGTAQQTYETAISKLNELWQKTQEDYSSTINQIKEWQTSAVSEAQQNFTNQLNEIANMKMGAAQNRSVQKMNVLSSYRDQLNNIKMTAWQYAEQAKQNAQNKASTFESYLKSIQDQFGIGTTDVANSQVYGTPTATSISSTESQPSTVTTPTGATTKKNSLLDMIWNQ